MPILGYFHMNEKPNLYYFFVLPSSSVSYYPVTIIAIHPISPIVKVRTRLFQTSLDGFGQGWAHWSARAA